MHGAQIPQPDRQAPFFPQRGDAATLTPGAGAPVPRLPVGRGPAPSTHWAGPGDEDMLGDLHRNHRQLDDFPGALDPAASQVRPAIGTVLHHVLHPMGRCHPKPWRRCLRGCCCAGGFRPDFALRPGIRRLAFQFGNPSNRSITRCCSRTAAFQLGDDGNQHSRSTVVRSTSVSMPCI